MPVAIAFFDVEGYTAFTAKHGDEAGLALADSLLDIAEQLVQGARGTVVKRLGDGLMASFPSAVEGLRCALGTQQALQARAALTDDAPVAAARIAMHWGEPILRDGDLYGNDVNVAARLAEQARGGQVLVTQAVLDELPAAALGGIDVKRLGRLSAKGLRERPVFHRVRAEAAPRDPLGLGEDGVVGVLTFDTESEDIGAFLAGMRAAEAVLNGIGARLVYTGVNIDEPAQPLVCALIVFPDEHALELFRTDPGLQSLREVAGTVMVPRVEAAYRPFNEFGVLFPGGVGG